MDREVCVVGTFPLQSSWYIEGVGTLQEPLLSHGHLDGHVSIAGEGPIDDVTSFNQRITEFSPGL